MPPWRATGVALTLVLTVAALGGRGLESAASAPTTERCALDRAARPARPVRCSVEVAGVLRTFVLSVPPKAGRAPLVVAYHGLHQTAETFAALTGLIPASRAAGLVLALPESSGPAFNDGRLGPSGPDDDAFTLALVRQVVSARFADPQRVVVTGFSNGAGMAMEVAARHPHEVSALVSVGGSLIDAPGAPRPSGAVRAYLVHGAADPVQPWHGRPAGGPLWPAYLPVPATVAQWVAAAGAGPETVERLPTGSGRAVVAVSTWASRQGGAEVVSYVVDGMGHVWPSGVAESIDATALVVRVSTSVDPGAESADRVWLARSILLGR